MTASPVSRLGAIRLVAGGVLLEMARRKEFAVLAILTGVFALGALVMQIAGIGNPATGTFVLNLGMTLAYLAAHILVIIFVARQIPVEIENRTIYPLLAKPLSRRQYIVGKWAACTAAGTITLAVLMLLAWLPSPKMETYHAATLAQMVVLHVASLAVLSGLGICLSIFAPQGVTIVVLALLLGVGDKIVSFATARAARTPFGGVVEWVANYVPDLSKLNLVTRYTDGIAPLSSAGFAGSLVYAGIILAVSLAIASSSFERRPL